MTASYGGSEDSLATTRSIDSDEKDTSPAEERERITRLEIAVTWIKQAVVSIPFENFDAQCMLSIRECTKDMGMQVHD